MIWIPFLKVTMHSKIFSRKGALPGQAYGVCAVNRGEDRVATSLRQGRGERVF
jgi:hypothetical protein